VLELAIMMNRPQAKLALLLAATILLGACAHSRIVQRSPMEPAQGHARGQSRAASSRASAAPLPRGAVHVVRAGETLYGISFRYGLRFQDVASWNGIGDPYVIEVGQRLRLRPASGSASAPPSRASLQAPLPATAGGAPAVTPRPPAPGTAAAAVSGRPPAAPVVTPGAAPAGNLPMPAWRWPAQGDVIGRYVSGDQTQQGINIAGQAGQDVAAAADGVVVYSGAGLVGYGELIIIKHSDEWLSAYAHNRRRLVSEGARVKAGDNIAEMGRTGAVREMLHFEIRRNGKPVDPLQFLPRR
jgi:lipoprotein NlpD